MEMKKGCYSNRTDEEKITLLKKFDDLRNEILMNRAIEQKK